MLWTEMQTRSFPALSSHSHYCYLRKMIYAMISVRNVFKLSVKMVNTVLTSSHSHIKITTKLLKSHHSEPPEIELNGSPKTRELKKPHQGWQEGQSCDRGWSHIDMWWNKLGGVSGLWRSPLEERGVPAPYQGPQPRVPVPGREVPITSDSEKQWLFH